MWKIIFAVLTVATMFMGVDCSGKVMKIKEAWTHAAPANADMAEVYLTIENHMGAPDTLTNVTTYAAESAVIMTTTNADGVNASGEAQFITIAADKDLAMSRNKTYILLKKLRQPLVAGEKFPITLTFEKAGPVLEDVYIQRPGTFTYGR